MLGGLSPLGLEGEIEEESAAAFTALWLQEQAHNLLHDSLPAAGIPEGEQLCDSLGSDLLVDRVDAVVALEQVDCQRPPKRGGLLPEALAELGATDARAWLSTVRPCGTLTEPGAASAGTHAGTLAVPGKAFQAYHNKGKGVAHACQPSRDRRGVHPRSSQI